VFPPRPRFSIPRSSADDLGLAPTFSNQVSTIGMLAFDLAALLAGASRGRLSAAIVNPFSCIPPIPTGFFSLC
jgi:hypothetical protein